MIATNYDDVLDQLRAAGLIVDRIELDRWIRVRVEGRGREKCGWYRLVEWYSPSGETLIVGSFGFWEGTGNNARRVELPKRDGGKRQELTDDQRDAFKRRLAEDRKKADQLRAADARRAADRASKAWAQCAPTGESDYLARKAVQGYGVRYSPSGALVIPMIDTAGKLHGLQVIRSRKVAKADGAPEKQYWPAGVVTRGHFHLIGSPQWILLIAEGYATAATLHQATGYPVAVAFDANNLGPVATALRKRYRRVQILICADDDILRKCKHCKARFVLAPGVPLLCIACGKEHGQDNPGVSAASTAAVEVGGSFIVPQFPDPAARAALFIDKGVKLTDFNDLYALPEGGGTFVVRSQVEARMLELGMRARYELAAISNENGAGGRQRLRPIGTVDELMHRFALVYGQGGAVFDRNEHQLVSLKDMSDACAYKYLHRTWMESADRAIVRMDEVGFDPGGEDAKITCNLWAGWPTTPSTEGKCDKLLDLLRHMCRGEDRAEPLYRWVLSWLAYPLQHPGAKMKTTLVLHGPQGTGKNLFFEAIMAIYGPYGRIIDQGAIEDKFNEWASRKLFLIADEVVARSDLYHIKNKLKGFITGEWIRINPKNIAAYDERNHVNMVFLSNEAVPVVLEEDDRRHTVIWTPPKMSQKAYDDVLAELRAGGVEALHDFLLHYDCGEFNPGTAPIGTDAKTELINQSLDSTTRFVYALQTGDIGAVKYQPALATEVYALYKFWCAQVGERHAPLRRLENALARKHEVYKSRKRYLDKGIAKNPQAFFMFTTEQPEGFVEQAWLGNCVEEFRDAVKEFRGTASD